MRCQSARLLLVAGALAAGCRQTANSLLVDLTDSDGARPGMLFVSLYDGHGPVMQAAKLKVSHWPGTLEIDHLPASTQPLRLVIASDSQPPALAGVSVMFVAGKQNRVAATLAQTTPDQDQDGVPDAVDDCPMVANAQQLDGEGDGTGDACALASDMAIDGGMDLSQPPDLLMPADMNVVASKCPSVTGAQCDGFEGGTQAFWSTTTQGGTLSVDSARAYRGNYSLHVHNDPFGGDLGQTFSDVRLSETTTLSGSTPSDLYLRAFMYLPSTAPNAVQLVTAVQQVSPYYGVGVNMDQGKVATFDSVAGGVYLKSSTSLPLNRWFCMQWHVHLATDTTGYEQVFLDGAEVGAVKQGEPTEPSPAEAVVSVGASFYNPPQPNPAFDLWVDEVEIGTSPISCTD